MIKLSLKTRQHAEFLNVTASIQRELEREGWREGILTVFVPHTTAGATIQENADPDVATDLLYLLEKTFPWEDSMYRHSEGNTAAHMKASAMGSSVQVIVENGELQLGIWQGIYFCEFDGPRDREVWINFTDK